MKRVRWACRTLAHCAIAAALQSAAWAGSFQVNPIRVDLSGRGPATSLSVKNTGEDAVVVQVSIEGWTQDAGKDVYAPTKDLLATPPVMTIPAGEERIVRVGLRRAPDRSKELSYRLFLQEVPPPPKPGLQGLVVALRIGLPVFVAPATGQASPKLAWRATRLPDNKLSLSATNSGNAHVQIAQLTVTGAEGDKSVATSSGLNYVLPDQTRDWVLPLDAPVAAARIRVKAVTDAGNLDADIDLQN